MQATDLKKAILENLRNFRNGDLLHNAKAILNTLGYQSDKTVDLSPNTPENFVETFGQITSLNADKALLKKWRTVDLIFQLTDEELNLAKVSNLRKDFEPKIYQSYLFIAIELEDDNYSRTKLVTITREVNKLFAMPVMVFFKSGGKLTVSIINRRPNKRETSKDVLEKVTLIKDINLEKPHRAHIEILFDLALPNLAKHKISNFLDLHEAWQKTLDISELNKKFYRELSAWYFWAVRNVRFPDDAEKDEEVRNATGMIRLITRLIFIWFLKEKGQIPDPLFDETKLDKLLNYSDKTGSTYYKAILQNLFFATLNTEMNRDKPGSRKFVNGQYLVHTFYRYKRYFKDENAALKLFEDIPFLNGGLFECLDRKDDDDNIIRIDGFSDNPKNEELLKVPDSLFWGAQKTINLSDVYDDRRRSREKVRGLIHILNSYKFTVAENTPLEEEVALDPELLGKVFENLLAAYNPETKTTARKQTGSFYTPREIVNYMVDESLIAYLETELTAHQPCEGSEPSQGSVNDRLRHLFEYTEEPHQFSADEVDLLLNAIDTCKILDPACGSGAFPMGILHRMVHLLGKLDPHNRKWKQKQIDKVLEIPDVEVREQLLQDIEQNFEENELDFGRKLYLIENCIYGVDIQPIACQIAKLRFFISLVVDQKVDRGKKNYGIRPLPNLETKFVAANTLIGIERPQQMSLRNPAIDAKEEELRKVRERHFTARTHKTKEKYRDLDAKLRKELAQLLREDGFQPETTNKLAQWNPYDQHASADFFDMEWMFGLSKGFDIVIGNPPYLESRSPGFTPALKNQLQIAVRNRWGDDAVYIQRGGDLLIYFIETSIYLISTTGHIVLITQNSWLDTEYGKALQEFLIRHTQVKAIIDSDYKYFDSQEGPNINTVISVFQGNSTSKENIVTFARCHENLKKVNQSLHKIDTETNGFAEIRRYSYSQNIIRQHKWGILLGMDEVFSDLLNVISDKGVHINHIHRIHFTLGQGINLTKDHLVDYEFIENDPKLRNAAIPILTASDGAPFRITKTSKCIIDKRGLSISDIRQLQSQGIKIFDSTSSRKKPPVLIMPRGIGRHYCALNDISAHSSSGVDVYCDSINHDRKVILNLWLFLNSSIAWLIRELSGRKNLGGGMLKAEAVDLKYYPVYFDFDNYETISQILETIQSRQAMDTLEEIETPEHKEIDNIVFSFLEINKTMQQQILELLKRKISERQEKSRT